MCRGMMQPDMIGANGIDEGGSLWMKQVTATLYSLLR
jgi:hypothetical protein